MDATRTTRSGSAAEAGAGISGILVGLGMIILALFPFAIPFLVLTLVFMAPLLIIGAAALVPVGILAGIVLAVRAVWARNRARAAAEGGDRTSAAASPAR